MTELVLDASVLVMWFRRQGEGDLDAALAIRTAFQEGALLLFAPPLLNLELINLAGRRWRWNEDRLRGVASALSLLNLQWVEPELDRVATWTGRGLTAYDAAYVAVAEAGGLHLITADLTILATAPSIARPLATWN
ncbi:MAG TPA: PIN domain-containing protein [Candidatus Dormibacteraeota bacterium]|nr:PIN domain-containing protein [Candidatus Dormibacteraeota bacterium]